MTIYLLVHVLFLIAISIRLNSIGYPKATVLKMVAFGLGCWPVVYAGGILFDLPVMYYLTGVPLIIGINMLVYIWMELKVLWQTPAEQAEREECVSKEEAEHQRVMREDAATVDRMVMVKSYVGDGSNLVVISDLGRLKDGGVACRIEGSLVKSILVLPTDFEAAAALLGGVEPETDGQESGKPE